MCQKVISFMKKYTLIVPNLTLIILVIVMIVIFITIVRITKIIISISSS